MNEISIVDQWIAEARSGHISWSELAERLLAREYPAGREHQPDVDRRRRCGFGEVIFGAGKSDESIHQIATSLMAAGQAEVLVTRVDELSAQQISARFAYARYEPDARTLRVSNQPIKSVSDYCPPALPDQPTGRRKMPASVAVVTAGSTDLPVAREALETLRWMGVDATLLRDVGIAGPYRLLPHLGLLRSCAVVVVVAGMEGALASVVGGLVACPVIAVPTSIGYGANLEGITTLLSMISSCASSVTVVNIDAGFKGGYVAGLIAHRAIN